MMNAVVRAVPALLCAALLGSSSIASEQAQTLRYRFAKGDAFSYRINATLETTLTGLPMGSLTLTQTLGQIVDVTVEEVSADGTGTLRTTFTSAKMDMTTPFGPITYDSASPKAAADPVSAMMAAMIGGLVGESITLVMSPTGSVQKVEGMAGIADKVSAALPQDPTGGMLSASLKAMLSDEAMRSTLETGFGHLSDKPVQPGDSWPGQIQIGTDATGKLSGALTTTLKSVDGTGSAAVARLGVALVLKQDDPGAPGPMGATMKLEEGKGEGEFLFEVEKGRMKSSTTRNRVTSALTMTARDGSRLNASSVIVGTTKVELVVKQPEA